MATIALSISPDTPSVAAQQGSGTGRAPAATQKTEAGVATSRDFFSLLLAGLGLQSSETAADDALPDIPETAPQLDAGPGVGRPGKTRSKVQPNALATAMPGAAVAPALILANLTPRIRFDLRAAILCDSCRSRDGHSPVAGGTDVVLPPLQPTVSVNDPDASGASSGSDVTHAEPGYSPLPDGAVIAMRPQGPIAFEARVHLPVSNVVDKSAWQTVAALPAKPAVGESPVAPALLPVRAGAAVGVADRKAAGGKDPATALQDRAADDPETRATSGADEDQNFSGREQQDPGNSRRPQNGTTESFPAAESHTSGIVLPEIVQAPGNPEPIPTTKAEPQLAPVIHGAPSDVAVALRASVPTRDIALQLQDAGGSRVDVQVADRGGTVHVVVRTQDDGLAKDLRTNLPDLAQKLNQQGLEADAWSPAEMRSSAGGHENPRHAHDQGDTNSSAGGQDSGGSDRQRRPRPDPEDEFRQSFSGLLTGGAHDNQSDRL